MKRIAIILLLALTSCDDVKFNPSGEEISKQSIQNAKTQDVESETFKKGKIQLESMGFTNIKESNYPFFCCSKDDSILWSTGFEATAKDGTKVEGCMCSAMFKGVTIRFK